MNLFCILLLSLVFATHGYPQSSDTVSNFDDLFAKDHESHSSQNSSELIGFFERLDHVSPAFILSELVNAAALHRNCGRAHLRLIFQTLRFATERGRSDLWEGKSDSGDSQKIQIAMAIEGILADVDFAKLDLRANRDAVYNLKAPALNAAHRYFHSPSTLQFLSEVAQRQEGQALEDSFLLIGDFCTVEGLEDYTQECILDVIPTLLNALSGKAGYLGAKQLERRVHAFALEPFCQALSNGTSGLKALPRLLERAKGVPLTLDYLSLQEMLANVQILQARCEGLGLSFYPSAPSPASSKRILFGVKSKNEISRLTEELKKLTPREFIALYDSEFNRILDLREGQRQKLAYAVLTLVAQERRQSMQVSDQVPLGWIMRTLEVASQQPRDLIAKGQGGTNKLYERSRFAFSSLLRQAIRVDLCSDNPGCWKSVFENADSIALDQAVVALESLEQRDELSPAALTRVAPMLQSRLPSLTREQRISLQDRIENLENRSSDEIARRGDAIVQDIRTLLERWREFYLTHLIQWAASDCVGAVLGDDRDLPLILDTSVSHWLARSPH